MRWLRALLAKPKAKADEKPWTVDRDGRVRLPERKIVLRAKADKSA